MGKNQSTSVLILLLMLSAMLSGCFGEAEEIVPETPYSPFSFAQGIPETTWYHYSGAVDATDSAAVIAANISANLSGRNMPFYTEGSYYSIGMTTFEPTIGVTSIDNL